MLRSGILVGVARSSAGSRYHTPSLGFNLRKAYVRYLVCVTYVHDVLFRLMPKSGQVAYEEVGEFVFLCCSYDGFAGF